MKTMHILIIVAFLGITAFCPVLGAGEKEGFLILPFDYGKETYVKPLAEEMEWLFGKKLKFWASLEILSRYAILGDAEGIPVISAGSSCEAMEKQLQKIEFPETVNWILCGCIRDFKVDKERKITGPALIGVCDIPIKANIRICLYDPIKQMVILEEHENTQGTVTTFRFLGAYRNPLPQTPRSIDAFIHESVLKLSQCIYEKIVLSTTPVPK